MNSIVYIYIYYIYRKIKKAHKTSVIQTLPLDPVRIERSRKSEDGLFFHPG